MRVDASTQMQSDLAAAQRASLAQIGVVVIGRNEAPRLGACLAALAGSSAPMVYVDSGSEDGSPEIAAHAGLRVIHLHEGPYTAARGRQTGFEFLRAHHPELQYVQFVDGDCILDAAWLARGVRFLTEHPRAGAVVGRLRERCAQRSLLIRLVDADWDLPTGDIDAVGGILMARIAALDEVGGWSTGLIAGEDLDLGARLRAAGWALHRLPADMTFHDIGIRTVGEMWRRSIRSGFSYAALAMRHGRDCPRWRRHMLSNIFYGAALPLALVPLLIGWWPGAAVIGAIYLLLMVRVAGRRLRCGDSPGFALLYALALVLDKVAGAWGTFKYLLTSLSGKPTRLIDYKAPRAKRGS